jgi:hypothetical protein
VQRTHNRLPRRPIAQLAATASMAALPGRRMRSAKPTIDPATAHEGSAPTRKTAKEQEPKTGIGGHAPDGGRGGVGGNPSFATSLSGPSILSPGTKTVTRGSSSPGTW